MCKEKEETGCYLKGTVILLLLLLSVAACVFLERNNSSRAKYKMDS